MTFGPKLLTNLRAKVASTDCRAPNAELPKRPPSHCSPPPLPGSAPQGTSATPRVLTTTRRPASAPRLRAPAPPPPLWPRLSSRLAGQSWSRLRCPRPTLPSALRLSLAGWSAVEEMTQGLGPRAALGAARSSGQHPSRSGAAWLSSFSSSLSCRPEAGLRWAPRIRSCPRVLLLAAAPRPGGDGRGGREPHRPGTLPPAEEPRPHLSSTPAFVVDARWLRVLRGRPPGRRRRVSAVCSLHFPFSGPLRGYQNNETRSLN